MVVLDGIVDCLLKNKTVIVFLIIIIIIIIAKNNNNNNTIIIICKFTNTENVFADVDCGLLPGLEHGYVNLKDKRTTHGASVEYTCHENYTLIGRERRTCQDDGHWSDDQPQCLCKQQ